MKLARATLPKQAILGLDIGSTFVKAVVFDHRGRALVSAARSVPVRRPQSGWVERDALATWRTVADLVRRVTAGRTVSAIGVTGCGNGAVFVAQNLRPLRSGILSSDQRAVDFVRRDPGARQTAYAGQTCSLLHWFRAAEPVKARELAYVLAWKDFIRAKLTGVIATEPTDAGAAGWLDVARRKLRTYDPAIPPLCESLASAGAVTASAAEVTGLREGTPVFMGCIDCEAAALGSGVSRAGDLSLVAGTWSINQMFVDRLPRRSDLFLVNPAVEPGRWLMLEGSPTSAANFDWAARMFAGGSAARALLLARQVRRTAILFYPHLPTGEGAFRDLDAAHGRGEMLRAVIEGVAFAHRAHVEKLLAGGSKPRRIRLAGGTARSPFVAQLFADVLGSKIEIPAGPEIGALGAALCAGVGVGIWPTLRVAQEVAVRIEAAYMPRPKAHTELTRDFVRFSQVFPP